MLQKANILILFLFTSFHIYAQDLNSVNIVSEIKIIGNKTTKPPIIIRELPFEIGDTLFSGNLTDIFERAQSNLFNTQLFNFITIQPVYFDSIHISIYITVEERWYWWAAPIFELDEINFNTWWKDKDFDRLSYGAFVAKENFRGRKERIAMKVQLGYTEEIAFRYSVPYLNKKKTQGFGVGASYNRNHQINYGTTANNFNYYKSDENFVRESFVGQVSYDFRPKLYNLHRVQLDYNSVEVADSIVFYNENYLTEGNNNSEFLSFRYYLNRDKRNLKWYPTKGYFYSFQLKQDGFGFFDEGIKSFTTKIDYRKYIPLSSRFYFASSIRGKYSFTNAPYYLQEGLAFGSQVVRGYELYVINGDHYGLFKSQLRYQLLNKVYRLNQVPLSKFNKIPFSIYVGAYFDAGYVGSKSTEATNFLTNKALMGGGFSIDFVSYYDLVFRIEYSVNKLKEHGLFLHFVAPI
jgi:outer membrane protein assembly factor BamA